jgi:hypothetical protein
MFAYVRICSLFWKNVYAGPLGRADGLGPLAARRDKPAVPERLHFAVLILKFWRILAFLYGFYAIEQ